MTIPKRQKELERFITQHFPKSANDPESNGGAYQFKPSPPRSDEQIIQACRAAKNATKFADLYNHGDVHRYHAGDDSSADAGLMEILAFQTQDPEQLEHLFGQSALGQRPKWNERADYRQRTINYVLGELRDTWQPRHDKAKLLVPSSSPSLNGSDGDDAPISTFQLSQVAPPRGPRPYLIEGVLPERFPTAIYGDGGTAKTTTVLHLLQSVVRGEKEWLGHKINRATGALFIDCELDLEEQARRAYEVAHGLGYTAPPDGLHYLSAVGHKARQVFSHALGFCKKNELGLVVVDSLGVAMEGDAELARDVLRFVREMLDPFRAAGITPLIVDHQSKLQAGERYQGKTMFGSVYKSNAVRSVFQLEVRERQEDGIKVTLRHKKSNFGALLNPFGARIEWAHDKTTISVDELTAGELAEESTMNVADRLVLALEGGPAYPEDLAAAIGAEYRTVKNKLSDLRKAGKVEDTGEVRNRSHEVRLAQSSSSLLLSDGDADANKQRTGNELWKDRSAELGRKL